jgi:hypothetical protein
MDWDGLFAFLAAPDIDASSEVQKAEVRREVGGRR